MLVSILGWFWVVTGVIFLIWPNFLKKRLQKKSYKIIRRYLFVVGIFLSVMLISVGLKATGAISKIILVIGLIALIKAVFLVKAKAAEKLVEFFIKQSLIMFRFWALVQIAIGVLILFVK